MGTAARDTLIRNTDRFPVTFVCFLLSCGAARVPLGLGAVSAGSVLGATAETAQVAVLFMKMGRFFSRSQNVLLKREGQWE